jgi:hypothetical protein
MALSNLLKGANMYSAAFLWQLSTEMGVIMPDDEKWGAIRGHRNEMLTKSDWSQLTDAPFTAEEKNVWTTYRQSLRDVPQDYGNPDDVMFPEQP